MEPPESEQNIVKSRAKEIDTGALPLSMTNVILGLPTTITTGSDISSGVARPWTFSELVSQKKLLDTLIVTTDTNERSPIWEFRNTWSNVYKTHFRKFNDLFLLKRWKVCFDIEVRSNFQQVGMLSLAYTSIPFSLWQWQQTQVRDFVHTVQLPHRLIMMGEDTNTSVSLNWLSPFSCSTTGTAYDIGAVQQADDYDMGTLFLMAPFKMNVASGVDSTLTVRIWTYLTDLEYSGYNPSDQIL